MHKFKITKTEKGEFRVQFVYNAEVMVWSENYDRPLDDKLMVQDDIAGEVTSALRGSID